MARFLSESYWKLAGTREIGGGFFHYTLQRHDGHCIVIVARQQFDESQDESFQFLSVNKTERSTGKIVRTGLEICWTRGGVWKGPVPVVLKSGKL